MSISRRRVIAARVLAVVADAIQFGLIPLFVEGAASPLNGALDLVVGAAMVALVGWHWVFLPTFVVELLPLVDVAPTWTVAAFIATRQRRTPPGNVGEDLAAWRGGAARAKLPVSPDVRAIPERRVGAADPPDAVA